MKTCVATLALALVALADRLVCAQELVFASRARAHEVLATKDAFVERMSPFDRAARLKTDRVVTEAEYLDFAGSAALDWDDAEKRPIVAAYRELEPKLAALHLPLPARILVVKTTGQEEGNAPYTRQTAVMIPRSELASQKSQPQRLLAHELFHIASRSDSRLGERLYAVIGFRPCGEATYPESLAARKITNPDAPRNDYCIRVTVDGESVAATPILFSRAEAYDPVRGGEFFEYLQLGLLVRPAPGQPAANARVIGLQQAAGFFEQVGQNTQYVVHPEEILADNFALLALGSPGVKSPGVLEGLRRALAELAAAPAVRRAR